MKDLEESIREMDRRPSMHPHSKHVTAAGPARHQFMESRGDSTLGVVHVGMRKYGPVMIGVPKRWPPKFASAMYSKAIMNAITTAWRC